jgi:N-acetylmuramoyl-L-alanine amidase
MEQSVDFASRVQNELVKTASRTDRGVRQAGFLVLWQTSMPAVLIELDFICNPTQAAFLGSKLGQEKMARSIFNAFEKYKEANDKKIAAATEHQLSTKENEIHSESITDDVNNDSDKELSLVYKVQFLASPDMIRKGDNRFKELTNVEYYRDGNLYKYTIGNCESEEDAKEILNKIKKKFKEAFIVVFEGDKRIK